MKDTGGWYTTDHLQEDGEVPILKTVYPYTPPDLTYHLPSPCNHKGLAVVNRNQEFLYTDAVLNQESLNT